MTLALFHPFPHELILPAESLSENLPPRVRALLRAHADPGSFLEAPAVAIAATIDMPPVTETVGSVIGPYKLMEQIGEGGMGVVYVAEQTEPVKRKVALKIIKPGMDTRQVIARFEAERQALAFMDHPNIAKVLDAGSTGDPHPSPSRGASAPGSNDQSAPGSPHPAANAARLNDAPGRPYFVMELVHGIPITEYCDQTKLDTRQRLDLFIKVCRAIQHAHQKGIIHRDIKPTNVLVTQIDGAAVPKVIDFGVAKAVSQKLTEQTLYTQFAQMIGTPLYMSPEQAQMSGVDVDTRSDVYSLGVLLYELLTDSTPFDKETLKQAGFDEMRRIIREEEPPRPSDRISTLHAEALSTVSAQRNIDAHKFSRQIQGELDWIVMQALEKDRTRRYESASAFAADIERYLSDEPVEACPPSAIYRLKKFSRRNKATLVTLVLVATSLLVGTAVSLWQAKVANDAQKLADDRLVLANKRLKGETKARIDADEQRKLADEQRKIAQENFKQARQAVDRYFILVSESTLLDEPGLQPLRLELIEAALSYYETFAARKSDDPQIQLELAATYLRLAQIYYTLFRHGDYVTALEKGLALVENSIQHQPAESEAYLMLSGFWHEGYGRMLHGYPRECEATRHICESKIGDNAKGRWSLGAVRRGSSDGHRISERPRDVLR